MDLWLITEGNLALIFKEYLFMCTPQPYNKDIDNIW